MDLLEQAKRKFKVGTVFSNVNLDCGCSDIKITDPSFKEKDKSISVDRGMVDGLLFMIKLLKNGLQYIINKIMNYGISNNRKRPSQKSSL